MDSLIEVVITKKEEKKVVVKRVVVLTEKEEKGLLLLFEGQRDYENYKDKEVENENVLLSFFPFCFSHVEFYFSGWIDGSEVVLLSFSKR